MNLKKYNKCVYCGSLNLKKEKKTIFCQKFLRKSHNI